MFGGSPLAGPTRGVRSGGARRRRPRVPWGSHAPASSLQRGATCLGRRGRQTSNRSTTAPLPCKTPTVVHLAASPSACEVEGGRQLRERGRISELPSALERSPNAGLYLWECLQHHRREAVRPPPESPVLENSPEQGPGGNL